MKYIIHIETAVTTCSVALSNNNTLIDSILLETAGQPHAEALHPLINKLLKRNSIEYTQIEAIGVNKGPGSYTGLRIGVSAAKGLAFALDIPIISTTSFDILLNSIKTISSYDFIIPMLDARRDEVYCAVYTADKKMVEPISAKIIDANSFSQYANKKVLFIGTGAAKCKELVQMNQATFDTTTKLEAKNMVDNIYQKLATNEVEDVAYFEPYYLKDFIALQSKKKWF